MRSIDAALPASDGVACFNRMYLQVTLGVSEHVEQGFFGDPAFVSQLDVVFANRYFAAVAAVANIIGDWSINAARDVAWDTALALWDVRDYHIATQLLTGALARTVAMASRGLLVVI